MSTGFLSVAQNTKSVKGKGKSVIFYSNNNTKKMVHFTNKERKKIMLKFIKKIKQRKEIAEYNKKREQLVQFIKETSKETDKTLEFYRERRKYNSLPIYRPVLWSDIVK